jgi:pyridoxamine 5'-phosphate oxidase
LTSSGRRVCYWQAVDEISKKEAVKILRLTPDEIRKQIWKELGRATQDRFHAWRTPVLATACKNGLVHARTVVLRNVDPVQGHIQIFTDARSPKVAEISDTSNAVFVFWSSKLRWQIRVRVDISALTTGPTVAACWERVKYSASAGDYLSLLAPGSLLNSDSSESVEINPIEPHFAVLNARITEIDWLELARTGHRRARFTSDSWEWLTP